ncbi:flagellar hook protein FlgE [Acetanaerobacterium elongatum]|uniref:Flagellar hook protein FlgE n=1 Tax=Acetanaerobacterium elongatum TaxID=258515 RepID=A0A1G9ZFF3_9FIRM|nr:flagellar hook-basal body complex protein [Acetanaerobacterium elongatum]SDN20152.1 flagellar hook protein FlgE [Acetanaerobacterium elongatum]
MVRAMYSGVAGLRAHQTRLDVIGNNIANVNTYGYKASRTTFRDVYYQSISGASGGTQTRGGVNATQVGYGAQVASIDINQSQSGFQPTDVSTDVAIAGQGYLQVMDASGNIYYTRAGMLTIDNNGNVIDSQGNFVLGVSGSGAKTAAPASGKIQIVVPPITDNQAFHTKTVSVLGVSQTVTLKAKGPGTLGNMVVNFITGTAGGGSKAVLDGTELNITLDPSANYTQADLDKLLTLATGTVGGAPDATNVGAITDKNGKVLATSAIPGGGFTLSGLTFPTDAGGNSIPLDGQQMKDILGAFKTEQGRSFALQSVKDLSSLAIGSDGIITGNHAVHGQLTLGRIDLAVFNNPEGLTQEGNSYFAQSANSGDPSLCVAGTSGSGPLKSGMLEMSNVDLSAQFTDMITTQRGFQACSRIITVTDSMLEELVNLKR